MKTILTLLTCALGLSLASASIAKQRIPVSAAEAQCKLQGENYRSKTREGGAIDPHNTQRFRACVFAKSGQYPAHTRKSGITISGSARIGIVYQE